jgi:putative flippase GtrA
MVSLFVARTWVFEAAHSALSGLAARFLASTVIFRLLNWPVFTVCFYAFALERELGIIVAIAAVLPVKYWTEKEFVFT